MRFTEYKHLINVMPLPSKDEAESLYPSVSMSEWDTILEIRGYYRARVNRLRCLKTRLLKLKNRKRRKPKPNLP